ncbi:MAG: FtsX-like permease family protein [bacterium]
MLIVKIAFRNIFRQKRRTILTLLTMIGGFTLAAISIGWSDGTYSRIIDMFTRNQLGHIQIHYDDYADKPTIYKTIKDYKRIGTLIKEINGVFAWSPRIYAAGLGSVKEKSTGVRIIGIDPLLENKATNFDKKISRGKNLSQTADHTVLIGKGLAKILKAEVSDYIALVSQGADGSIANDLYEIIGIIDSGDPLIDRMSCYMHIDDAQELFVLYNGVHEMVIVLDKVKQVKEYTAKIVDAVNNNKLSVEPWQVFAKEFYQAMKADQKGMWITLCIIILIVAIGVLNTVLMAVLERRREYGLLKAVGTRPNQILSLVIYEVVIMAVISVIIASMISVILNYVLSLYGIPLPETFTYGGMQFNTMYSEINARSFYIPAVTVLLSAVCVGLFPAWGAARVDPAHAMRVH